MFLKPENIAKAKAYLAENNKKSGAPFSACLFGNAFTGEEVFIGAGEGRVGEEVNDSMYWRWASMTKIHALIILSVAIDEGFIDSLDDKVSKYIPEFSQINSYVSSATPIPGETDPYGVQSFTMNTTTQEGLGDTITIRQLITMKSGLGCLYLTIGKRRPLLKAYENVPAGQRFISYVQYMDSIISPGNAVVDPPTAYYYKTPVTVTDYILERVKHPLIFAPGTDVAYGTDPTIIGAVIGAALQRKGYNITCAQYIKYRIYDPLGMNKTWLTDGSLNPPNDVLEKLTDAYFVRDSNVDGLQGPNVKLDTLYRCFSKDAQGDGFAYQELNQNLVNQTVPPIVDKYAGGFDMNGVGTLRDYVKPLKLLINKGLATVSDGNGGFKTIRLLSEQAVEWILNVKSDQKDGMWAYGLNTLNLLTPNDAWAGCHARFNANSAPTLPYEYNSNMCRWGGYYGTTYLFDIKSGNYIVSGTQVSGASWQVKDIPLYASPSLKAAPESAYQPSAEKLFQILCAQSYENY